MSQYSIEKLKDKKVRNESGKFLVEGAKSIEELLRSDLVIDELYGTDEYLNSLHTSLLDYKVRTKCPVKIISTKDGEISKLGTLVTNDAGIAIARQRKQLDELSLLQIAQNALLIGLDDVRDPSNLGAIVRIADWFGVSNIIASQSTTDFYNPKCIAASVGSFTRVNISYLDLSDFMVLASREKMIIRSAVLDGKDVADASRAKSGILIMGSESHGISDKLLSFVTERLTIPRIGGAESLNVAVATGIILSSLLRTRD